MHINTTLGLFWKQENILKQTDLPIKVQNLVLVIVNAA
jgi:hypothetical protein